MVGTLHVSLIFVTHILFHRLEKFGVVNMLCNFVLLFAILFHVGVEEFGCVHFFEAFAVVHRFAGGEFLGGSQVELTAAGGDFVLRLTIFNVCL